MMPRFCIFLLAFLSSCSHLIFKKNICPEDMALVQNPEKKIRVCVAIYEHTFIPNEDEDDDPDPYKPAGYMNYHSCKKICQSEGGRLLNREEWEEACSQTPPDQCNKFREHPLLKLAAREEAWYYRGQNCKMPKNLWGDCMNDPKINKLPKGLATNRDFPDCISKYGIRHMIGNLGEWVEGNYFKNGVLMGQFNGGLYPQPRSSCSYKTIAHGPSYKDYSIGCRCGKDVDL